MFCYHLNQELGKDRLIPSPGRYYNSSPFLFCDFKNQSLYKPALFVWQLFSQFPSEISKCIEMNWVSPFPQQLIQCLYINRIVALVALSFSQNSRC